MQGIQNGEMVLYNHPYGHLVYDLKNQVVVSSIKYQFQSIHVQFSQDAKWILVSDIHKNIIIYDSNGKCHHASVIPKKMSASQFLFYENEWKVIYADKFGDYYELKLQELLDFGVQKLKSDSQEQELDGRMMQWRLLGGHVSIVTDLMILNDKLLTADRDEKIRISKYPDSYNIESFLLGHKSFISSMCPVMRQKSFLVSGGGDRELICWDLETSSIDHKIPIVSKSEEEVAVRQILNYENEMLIVLLEADKKVLIFKWIKEKFELHQTLQLDNEAVFAFLHNDQLFITLSYSDQQSLLSSFTFNKETQNFDADDQNNIAQMKENIWNVIQEWPIPVHKDLFCLEDLRKHEMQHEENQEDQPILKLNQKEKNYLEKKKRKRSTYEKLKE